MAPFTSRLGARLKALREQRGLSQDQVAELLGFNDRQTVSAIETGVRALSAAELLLAVEKFGVSFDDFTDPFKLMGDGRFSWRQTNVSPRRLESFEAVAGRWIAAFRELAPKVGVPQPLFRRVLSGIAKRSSYDDAMEAGERFAEELGLGDVPATRLSTVMENELSILVLMVDATEGVSGAACRLPELDVVLVNRKEVPDRRHFDLAHELFHILTWEAMPPAHAEEATETSRDRVEQLANSFAGALLMPEAVLDRYADWTRLPGGDALTSLLDSTARSLQVTGTALKWRLVGLGHLSQEQAASIADEALRTRPRTRSVAESPADYLEVPPLFSRRFMEVLACALDEGRLSRRRAADLTGLMLEDLADLFRAHGLESPYDM
jgi:Zn-dependent peptidase ImmA (M78 family)/DNA-binding XRE family transcriptional regulator